MRRSAFYAMLAAAAGILTGVSGEADARSRYYDLNILLDQPHPLAGEAPPAEQRTAPVPPMQLHSPARVPAPGSSPRYIQPAPTPTSPTRPATPAELAQMVEPAAGGPGGILSEIRIGGLLHDEGPFSHNKEEGMDVNLEVLFVSPKLLDVIWSPRPHVGASLSTEGDTSHVYLGLSWEWTFLRGWFAGFSLGGAVHDGELKTDRLDRKELGCRLLFRESIEGGYRFAGRHGLSLFLDHISNANLCDENEGLESFGLRYGYRL